MTTQTQEQRDYAYIRSTSDLLMETFEAQNIPDDIATVALMETMLKVQARQSEDLGQFIDIMRLIITKLYDAVPKFMMDLISGELNGVKDDGAKIHFLVQLVRGGPSSIKLKDGKPVQCL